ncbi:myotubularin-related protein 10-B-like isoform X1 [Macrosteles quadrilineatus]|uniref:myotubularin-related protein 10-B-like isoform X1 n=1 Tax=Macrosteles quadrilineatus TaxID=74068 RepID=UPI0023E33711|nr:myotubularin-related protein 10-B-like isoform X1 [Macrosteles quadrilineatus]
MFFSKMSDKRLTNSFKSYVGFDDEPLNNSAEESFSEQLSPRCLPGEMVIAEATHVLLFSPVSEHKRGKSGSLIVTNFKLSFVTTEEYDKDEMYCQENLLLGEYDICLSNVDALYLHVGDKKRSLLPGKNVSEKVKGLVVVCKNMRVMTFSFKFSPVGHGRNLTNALLHHAFPKRHQLLFAYDFREPYDDFQRDLFLRFPTPMFHDPGDWGQELARTGGIGWRLTSINKEFKMAASLPEWIVVPSSASDPQLLEAARHFRGGRPPLWCWSSPRGAALVRMSDIQPFLTDRRSVVVTGGSDILNSFRPDTASWTLPRVKENTMLETVRKSHPRLAQPKVMELNKDVPSPRELQVSFVKLRDLCAPESIRQFWAQDNHFLSILEGSRWLHYVSICLAKAHEAALGLHNDFTVVLQEGDGYDMCCVVASLAQILIDPHYRTIIGFQSLVQKEWVALGHPFCTRLGHVYNMETQEAPVFLLFLDCVWQLLEQFPGEFQFTETYLTTLWDSAHISVFETFLFDCERDRKLAMSDPNNPLTIRPVWDWGEQFSERDVSLFSNPLYTPPPPSPYSLPPLQVQTGVSSLQIWSQCYFRFIPSMEIIGGGKPQVDLNCRLLVSQIDQLDRGIPSSPSQLPPPLESLSKIGSFFPFSRRANAGPVAAALLSVSSLTLNTSFLSSEGMLDSQSILNAPD